MTQFDINRVSAPFRSRITVALAVATLTLSSFAGAHHPDKENQPVHPRIDVIGPIGNRLPPGYRRTYNRPSYLLGKMAYLIAPSSQEAMAWHRAVHADAYKEPKKHLRLEQHYFYPKPYDALLVGPRRPKNEPAAATNIAPETLPEMLRAEELDSIEPLLEPKLDSELELPNLELPELEPAAEEVSPSDSDSLGSLFRLRL